MRTIFCVLATLMLGLTSLQAQSLKAIKLNAPDKTRGASVMKALATVTPSASLPTRNSAYKIFPI